MVAYTWRAATTPITARVRTNLTYTTTSGSYPSTLPECPEITGQSFRTAQELRRGEFTLHLPVLVAKVTVE